MTDRDRADSDTTGGQPEFATGGESQGRAQPGDAEARKKREKSGSSFKGGQSERAYHGTGQLGEQKVAEEPNPNATATD